MPHLIVVLLLVGAALVIFEAFTPGFGFFGVTGIIALLVSAVLTVIFIPFGLLYVAGGVAAFGALLTYILRYVKKKQLYGRLILTDTLNEDRELMYDASMFMGKTGVAVTALKPVGRADFNGNVLEVYSEGAFILKDQKVRVVDVNKKKITVKAVE